MPELPEAEYMVRRLQDCVPIGTRVRRVECLRPGYLESGGIRRLTGVISGFSRRAKNVLIHLDTDLTYRIQLGMTGHTYWIPGRETFPPHTRAVFRLDSGAIVCQDPRVFGAVELVRTPDLASVFSEYGPEPLDPGFRWRHLKTAAQRSRGPIKPFLLDQSKVAGLGNIWAAEALFAARIAATRPVDSLSDAEWRALHSGIRRVLTGAIANTYRVTQGPADFPEADLCECHVYGRAGLPCSRCRIPIVKTVLAGRATYQCLACQL
jgi:formamidopyrimidine-DNA glycosylase